MRFLFLIGVMLLSFPVMALEAWEQVKHNSAVTVFTKQVDGNPYKSFKAVGIVQSTPLKLLEVLDDVTSYGEWFAYLRTVRLLKKEGNEKFVYMETNFPWPFKNEDITYMLSVSKNEKGGIKLTLDGKPDYIPAVHGVKRMRDAKGYILLQPEDDHTIVTYVMHTELSGDIPPWVANKYIHLMPFETLNNLIDFSKF
jgi:hypothetical protein